MKILLIANRAPWPPINGATVRHYHLIRALKARGDEVHVFGFAAAGERAQAEQETARLADSAAVETLGRFERWLGAGTALLAGEPLSVGWYRNRRLRQRWLACLDRVQPDAIIAYSSNVAPYVPPALRSRAYLDMVDVDSEKFAQYARAAQGPARWLHALEAKRLRRWEVQAAAEFAGTSLVTEREAGSLLPHLPGSVRERLVAIPNGVDTEGFRPASDTRPVDELPPHERAHLDGNGPHLVFTGMMDYLPNIDAACWFAREILPRVREHHPGACFVVVGARPAPAVRALADLPGVRVTGFVERAAPYLRAAQVAVMPLRIARGIQNKALEAMASAAPCVATRTVAEGVSATHQRELLVADEAQAFAQAVVSLLDDSASAQALGLRARAHVEQRFGWQPLMQRLIDEIDARVGRAAGVQTPASVAPVQPACRSVA
jgi:sugar transferase (PEP-CTERM/EpsH1 system associated)